jgi:hypothetical protein
MSNNAIYEVAWNTKKSRAYYMWEIRLACYKFRLVLMVIVLYLVGVNHLQCWQSYNREFPHSNSKANNAHRHSPPRTPPASAPPWEHPVNKRSTFRISAFP